MINNYKEYNNINQQSKESMIAKAAENSNTNENTLINNTDEVEELLRSVIAQLQVVATAIGTNTTAVNSATTAINEARTTITGAVNTQGDAIVSAINNHE